MNTKKIGALRYFMADRISCWHHSSSPPFACPPFKDKALPRLVAKGVAFHHGNRKRCDMRYWLFIAGLHLDDRVKIEELFLNRQIRVIGIHSHTHILLSLFYSHYIYTGCGSKLLMSHHFKLICTRWICLLIWWSSNPHRVRSILYYSSSHAL